jgi:hypothetical protein
MDDTRRGTSYPPDPEDLGDPLLRMNRGAPRRPLADSYALQSHVLTWGGRRVEVGLVAGSLGLGPVAPAYFVSAWNPRGEPSTFEENDQAHRLLQWQLEEVALPAVGVAVDRTWFESEVLVQGWAEDDVRVLAAELGQPAFVRWQRDELAVLATGRGPIIREAVVPAFVREWPGVCPLRLDDAPTQPCVRRGGPYGSRAIHAGALSDHHRAVGVTLLGCGVCQGRPLSPGGAISLAPLIVSSRYGGGTWRSDRGRRNVSGARQNEGPRGSQ